MAYTIGHSQRLNSEISEFSMPDAQSALKEVLGLQKSDEKIRFIKAPWGGEIGVEELRMYAEKEAKET